MQLELPITAYIALGANLGDRAASLRRAIEVLGSGSDVRVTRVSSFLENPAVGGPADAPPFLNAVAEVRTRLSPALLLARLLETEQAMGRVRRERWGPRTIDLDLLMYSDLVLSTDELTLPHPRLHERRFVLAPLAEIAPDLVHPTLRKSVRELLDQLKHEGDVKLGRDAQR